VDGTYEEGTFTTVEASETDTGVAETVRPVARARRVSGTDGIYIFDS
jgi:hypothetical protein